MHQLPNCRLWDWRDLILVVKICKVLPWGVVWHSLQYYVYADAALALHEPEGNYRFGVNKGTFRAKEVGKYLTNTKTRVTCGLRRIRDMGQHIWNLLIVGREAQESSCSFSNWYLLCNREDCIKWIFFESLCEMRVEATGGWCMAQSHATVALTKGWRLRKPEARRVLTQCAWYIEH